MANASAPVLPAAPLETFTLAVPTAIVIERVPLLVNATACIALVVPTSCGTKLKLDEESTAGPSSTPVPTANELCVNVPAADVATTTVADALAASDRELKLR